MTSCASRRRPLLVALVVAGVGAFIPGTAPPLISRCPSAAATDGAAADGAAAAEIPEPLTPLERVQRAAQFWQKVVPALAGYGGLIAELQFRKQLLGPEWCLSDEECEVRWDDVHGDRVEPRPYLTYHPELLEGGDKPLKGEVARMEMRHVHLPELTTFQRVDAGLRLAHHKRDAKIFYAGAWTHHFSMSHPGAVHSGLDVALSLGVALDPHDFFLGRWYKDAPPTQSFTGGEDWKDVLRESGGEWSRHSPN